MVEKPSGSGVGGVAGGAAGMRSIARTIPGPARMDSAKAGSVTAGQAAQMALQVSSFYI